MQLIECALDKQNPWRRNSSREPTFFCYGSSSNLELSTETLGLFLRVYKLFTNEKATISTKDVRDFLEHVMGPPVATSPLPCIAMIDGIPASWFVKSKTDGWMGSGPLWVATRRIPHGTAIQATTNVSHSTIVEDTALLADIDTSHPSEAVIIRSALASYDPETKNWNPNSLPLLKRVLGEYVTFVKKHPMNNPLRDPNDGDDVVNFWQPC